jgi:hypothetical protein
MDSPTTSRSRFSGTKSGCLIPNSKRFKFIYLMPELKHRFTPRREKRQLGSGNAIRGLLLSPRSRSRHLGLSSIPAAAIREIANIGLPSVIKKRGSI